MRKTSYIDAIYEVESDLRVVTTETKCENIFSWNFLPSTANDPAPANSLVMLLINIQSIIVTLRILLIFCGNEERSYDSSD